MMGLVISEAKGGDSRIVSWNACSRQFIDPPVFQLLALPGMATYRACVESGGVRWTVVSRGPRESALRLARAAADWALKNRLPDSGALPLFPYTTIAKGKFFGGVESKSVNLLRASWIGLSLVRLYEATSDARYLEYARHIARVTKRFQAADRTKAAQKTR
jgi:hypothetical protein